MVLTIGIGVAWTFGVTQLLIGHLNMATGFLFTIIAGNGINFGIIYMARFLEARRHGSAAEAGVLDREPRDLAAHAHRRLRRRRRRTAR